MRSRLALALACLVFTAAPIGLSAIAAPPRLTIMTEPTAVVSAERGAGTITNDHTVTVPYGVWIAAAGNLVSDALTPAVLAGFAWLLIRLPAPIVRLLRTMQAEQLLARAIGYGYAAVAGAARDRALSVDVGSKVVAAAANYAIAHGPDWLSDWMGGVAGIEQKILARLDLKPETSADALGVPPVPAPKVG
jgi:hypothetical protein